MYEFPIIGWTVSTIWALFILAVWISIAFWPARVADHKGHSFFGYFVLSLFFFPLALIMAYMVSDRSGGGSSSSTAPPAPKDDTHTDA